MIIIPFWVFAILLILSFIAGILMCLGIVISKNSKRMTPVQLALYEETIRQWIQHDRAAL